MNKCLFSVIFLFYYDLTMAVKNTGRVDCCIAVLSLFRFIKDYNSLGNNIQEESSNDIKIYNIKRCNNKTYYPVTVTNVQFELKNRDVFVSGSLTTDIDINSPVTASLHVDRYFKPFKIWFPLPCIDDIGSCTYDNLCSWGRPQNETCPQHFLRDKVPCRCPISEGSYEMNPDNKTYLFTIPMRTHLFSRKLLFSTPAAGTYSVHATITSGSKLLTCYEFYIDYSDSYDTTDSLETNDIWPSVEPIH